MDTERIKELQAMLPHDMNGDVAHTAMLELTVVELRVLNKILSKNVGESCDAITAITTASRHRWDALAHVGYFLAKKSNPQVVLGQFTGLSLQDLAEVMMGDNDDDDEVPDPNDDNEPEPDSPAEEPTEEQIKAAESTFDREIRLDPTAPTP